MAKAKPPEMTVEEAVHRVMTQPTINIWPELGLLLNVGKYESYETVRRGEIEVIRVGRLIKPLSAPLRKMLKLEKAA